MKNNYKYKGMFLFTYAPIGIICPLIGQYLNQLGFSGTQIGAITSIGTAVSIFAATFWGKKYSNSKDRRKVIFLLCIMAGVMAIICSHIMTFALFTIMYSVMYFFQGPVMSLTDAMVLEDNEKFSSIRLWGSIGYALAVFMAGKVGEAAGLNNIFVMYAVAFVIGGFMAMSLNKRKPYVPEDKVDTKVEKVKFSQLFKERKAIELIICGIFIFGTNVANNTYFGFLFKDGGGTVAGIGLAFLLMAGSEAPFMAIVPKVADKITPQRLIAASMVISALRFAWYATGPSYTALLVTFFLQGIVNGIILVEYVKYISQVVDTKLIGITISAFYAISSSGGPMLCNFVGGILMDYVGVRGAYGFFAILNIIGLLLYVMFGLHKPFKGEDSR